MHPAFRRSYLGSGSSYHRNMAIDGKYGHVTTEHGTIGEEEPVVVFRAQDKLLVPLLHMYYQLCDEAGVGQHHLNVIDRRIAEIEDWQHVNATKVPDTTQEQVLL